MRTDVSAPQPNRPAEQTWQLPRRQISFARPLVMGIVNVTPDSFSDGGQFAATDRAIAHALELVAQGADILDIGGESTRPGAASVGAEEEWRRVEPVVRALSQQVNVPISVDTSKAIVARVCLEHGAEIINDVTALTGDPDMTDVALTTKAGVILMHMQGTPQTMQLDPQYDDVVADIGTYLQQRLQAVVAAGIETNRVVLDPGFGFGKSHAHNLQILARLAEFQNLGRPVCLGVSRKGTISKILNRPVEQRVAGGLTILCHAMSQNAVQIVRVHDVAPTRDAVLMWQALTQARSR